MCQDYGDAARFTSPKQAQTNVLQVNTNVLRVNTNVLQVNTDVLQVNTNMLQLIHADCYSREVEDSSDPVLHELADGKQKGQLVHTVA